MQDLDCTITRACRNAIGDVIRRSAARSPEKEALIFGGRRWSYAELDTGANRVANALLAQGLEKGDRGGRLWNELLTPTSSSGWGV